VSRRRPRRKFLSCLNGGARVGGRGSTLSRSQKFVKRSANTLGEVFWFAVTVEAVRYETALPFVVQRGGRSSADLVLKTRCPDATPPANAARLSAASSTRPLATGGPGSQARSVRAACWKMAPDGDPLPDVLRLVALRSVA